MIARISMVLIALAIIILGIGSYLSPDDISGCKEISESGDCRAADAIVVISGGDTIARTDEAIRLFQAGWAPLIVFSGAAADKDSPSNAQVMLDRALDKGVSPAATIIEDLSETTKQNAERVYQQLEGRGVKRVILVTSGYHMRRASLEFKKRLDSEIELVRHPVASDKQWGPFWWLTPWGWWMAITELAKIGAFYAGGSR